MKKSLSIIITLLLIAALLAGCSGTGNNDAANDAGTTGNDAGGDQGQSAPESALTGTTADILEIIIDEAAASIGGEYPLPETLIDPVTPENAPGMLGITPDDFVSLVDEATSAIGAIFTFAFQVAVVKCNDANDALTVSGMIQSGYDSGKWISVIPEQSLTMVSGPYVLLAVGTVTQTDALAAAFKDAAGEVTIGPVIFYQGELGGAEGDVEFNGSEG